MLATTAFGKQPIKGPTLKRLRLFSPLHENMKGYLSKCAVLKVGLLKDHQIYCLQACVCVCVCVCMYVCALFQPENFTGWGSEGVNFVVIVLSSQASSSVFVFCETPGLLLPTQGDVVYVNYGRIEDFDYLANHSINVTGKIVIARYGKIYRGDKVGKVGFVLSVFMSTSLPLSLSLSLPLPPSLSPSSLSLFPLSPARSLPLSPALSPPPPPPAPSLSPPFCSLSPPLSLSHLCSPPPLLFSSTVLLCSILFAKHTNC